MLFLGLGYLSMGTRPNVVLSAICELEHTVMLASCQGLSNPALIYSVCVGWQERGLPAFDWRYVRWFCDLRYLLS